MDCSGLTGNAFQAISLTLPRTAEGQSLVGEKVKQKKLSEGDLVFFATSDKKRKITHVGIVTEVKAKENVKFIHASTSLGVVETDLYSDYYRKRFRTAASRLALAIPRPALRPRISVRGPMGIGGVS